MGRSFGRHGLIVVDSSAIVAVILGEPTGPDLAKRLVAETESLLSVANYVEAGQVLGQRNPAAVQRTIADFHDFLSAAKISLAPIDEVQARLALDARIRYGRGFGHPARLNYSDCFAYALAKARNLPLLFIGEDFTHTDIVPALA
jgi:ribonuclease VapC